MDRKKISIGISGFFGFINLIIAVYLLGWSSSFLELANTIRMILIPSGVLAIVGAAVEFRSLIIGSILCLAAVILSIIVSITLNYTYYRFSLYLFIITGGVPSLFIIIGGILGLWEYYKPSKK
ncbi:MAG: hypothetical protein ACFFBF_10505, partial [Promethearchaeota archaeon]